MVLSLVETMQERGHARRASNAAHKISRGVEHSPVGYSGMPIRETRTQAVVHSLADVAVFTMMLFE
jgi:hypothetical protein